MIAEESIYTDANGNIVAENNPHAAFLLLGKGSEIPLDVQDKLLAAKLKKASVPPVPKDASERIKNRRTNVVKPERTRK